MVSFYHAVLHLALRRSEEVRFALQLTVVEPVGRSKIVGDFVSVEIGQ